MTVENISWSISTKECCRPRRGLNPRPPGLRLNTVCLFVCVEVLRPSQPDGVMSSAVSLPNHMFTGQALSSKRLTSIVHILSPETDNCPSWISGKERMTVENISWSISTKECCRPRRGSNPRPPGLQSDAHPTEPPRPAIQFVKWLRPFRCTVLLAYGVYGIGFLCYALA